MKLKKLEFHWAVVFAFVLIFSMYVFYANLDGIDFLGRFNSLRVASLLLFQILLITSIISIIAYKKRITFKKSLDFLGVKKITKLHVLFAFAFFCFSIFGDLFIAWQFSKENLRLEMKKDSISLFLYVVISAGFFEEVVFRGFFYKWLREKRSYFDAAFLSGVLWALYHLSNLRVYSGLNVTGQMFLAFILSFPACYVFERAGNVIWPFAISHICLDLFPALTNEGSLLVKNEAKNILRCALVLRALCIVLSFLLANYLWPATKKRQRAGKRKGLAGNWFPKRM